MNADVDPRERDRGREREERRPAAPDERRQDDRAREARRRVA
jgi:hypothetical protein